jgi:hypothetical protein
LEIINDEYNHVDIQDFGTLTLNQFLDIATRLMPTGFGDRQKLASIFKVFSEEESAAQSKTTDDLKSIQF